MSINQNNISHPVLDFLSLDGTRTENLHQEPSPYQQTLKSPASVSLSLRTRENCALELKKIFDQITTNVENKHLKDGPIQADAGIPSAKEQSFSHRQVSSTIEKGSDSTSRHVQQGFLPWALSRPNVHNSTRQSTAQLTIFYSGTVNVFDDVPADKANAIMLLAGAANSCIAKPVNEGDKDLMTTPLSSSSGMSAIVPPATGGPTIPVNSTVILSSESSFNKLSAPSMVPSTAFNSVYTTHSPLQSPLPTDAKTQARKPHSGTELPQARKASLARFLEKRKDRVQVQPQMNGTAHCDGEKDARIREERDRSPKRLAVKSKEPSDDHCCSLLTSKVDKALDTVKHYSFLDR